MWFNLLANKTFLSIIWEAKTFSMSYILLDILINHLGDSTLSSQGTIWGFKFLARHSIFLKNVTGRTWTQWMDVQGICSFNAWSFGHRIELVSVLIAESFWDQNPGCSPGSVWTLNLRHPPWSFGIWKIVNQVFQIFIGDGL